MPLRGYKGAVNCFGERGQCRETDFGGRGEGFSGWGEVERSVASLDAVKGSAQEVQGSEGEGMAVQMS